MSRITGSLKAPICTCASFRLLWRQPCSYEGASSRLLILVPFLYLSPRERNLVDTYEVLSADMYIKHASRVSVPAIYSEMDGQRSI